MNKFITLLAAYIFLLSKLGHFEKLYFQLTSGKFFTGQSLPRDR